MTSTLLHGDAHASLPQHADDFCQPSNSFLQWYSTFFHTCVPTPLAFLSTILGIFSILSWLFAQLPQIYKNYQIGSTAGLSFLFLAEWCLGDLSNLIGALFTGQALWQVVVAGYYCFVDFVLVFQWLWYEHFIYRWGNRKGKRDFRSISMADEEDGDLGGSRTCLLQESKEGLDDGDSKRTSLEPVPHSNPRDIFVTSPTADELALENDCNDTPSSRRLAAGLPISENSVPSSSKDNQSGTRKSSPSSRTIERHAQSPSPSSMTAATRTFAYVALIIAISSASSSASPTQISSLHINSAHSPSDYTTFGEPSTVTIGRIASWLSTFLYLGSRLPQIIKNFLRRSTAGLSLSLFIAAFFGNFFYASSILANPCAWSSYPPNGAQGWVGPEGNDRMDWIGRATPFWLGAAGVLMMDAAVGVQFWMYGDGEGLAKPRSRHHHHHHNKKSNLVDKSYNVQPSNSQHTHRSYGSIADPTSTFIGSSNILNKSGTKCASIHDAASARDGHEFDNSINYVKQHHDPSVDDTRRWHRNVSGWMRGWVPGTPLGPGFFRRKKEDPAGGTVAAAAAESNKTNGQERKKKRVANGATSSDTSLSSPESSSSAGGSESECESEYMSIDNGESDDDARAQAQAQAQAEEQSPLLTDGSENGREREGKR